MFTTYKLICLFLVFITINFVFPSSSAFDVKSLAKKIYRFPRKVGQFLGFKESCSDKWIRTDKNVLKSSLEENLLGQPVVLEEIPEIFSKHWSNQYNSNYLMLCFYGSPGTGKTFTTKLLNKFIFKQGDKSYYYLLYNGAESYLGQEGQNKLKEQMRESIEDTIEECPYSMIVFDEVDKYPHGFLDKLILPIVENRRSPHKATFIFLTNVGSSKLMERSLEIDSSYFMSHYLGNYDSVKNSILSAAEDSFYSSNLVKKGHMKHFIPFLPHKEDSFIKCLERALTQFDRIFNNEPLKSTICNSILKETQLVPPSNPTYISSGCKRLESFISMEIMKLRRLNALSGEL